MKNMKAIAAAGSVLIVLAGASAWMRSPQEEPEEAPAATRPPTAKLSGAAPPPKLDLRAESLNAKGTMMMVEGKLSQAVEAFQQSLQVQEDPFVRFQMGRALAKAGRKDEARQAFQRVTESSAKWGSAAKRAMDNLGRG